ncbi:hypothetical protein DSO57_1002453 [Entomophthora muscae]|nr:hypothetical protein DSO57_1002453 [Entomophthora muscae]
MKASSASIWFLTSAIGNFLISLSELVFTKYQNILPWFYVGTSLLGFLWLLLLKRYYFVYKEDEYEVYDDEETFSVSHDEREH